MQKCSRVEVLMYTKRIFQMQNRMSLRACFLLSMGVALVVVVGDFIRIKGIDFVFHS